VLPRAAAKLLTGDFPEETIKSGHGRACHVVAGPGGATGWLDYRRGNRSTVSKVTGLRGTASRSTGSQARGTRAPAIRPLTCPSGAGNSTSLGGKTIAVGHLKEPLPHTLVIVVGLTR